MMKILAGGTPTVKYDNSSVSRLPKPAHHRVGLVSMGQLLLQTPACAQDALVHTMMMSKATGVGQQLVQGMAASQDTANVPA